MTIIIELSPGIKAQIKGDRWYSRSRWITKVLNREEREFREYEFPGHTPTPEQASAEHIIKVFGGHIVSLRNQLVLKSEKEEVY